MVRDESASDSNNPVEESECACVEKGSSPAYLPAMNVIPGCCDVDDPMPLAKTPVSDMLLVPCRGCVCKESVGECDVMWKGRRESVGVSRECSRGEGGEKLRHLRLKVWHVGCQN